MKTIFWTLFVLTLLVLGAYSGAAAGHWNAAPWMGKSLLGVAAAVALFAGYIIYRTDPHEPA